jgi:hypothetical protein
MSKEEKEVYAEFVMFASGMIISLTIFFYYVSLPFNGYIQKVDDCLEKNNLARNEKSWNFCKTQINMQQSQGE